MSTVIDELQVKINSQVQNTNSIKSLVTNLKSLAKVTEKLVTLSGALDNFGDVMKKLSGVDISGVTNSLQSLKGFRSTGISNLSKSLADLSRASGSFNPSSLDGIATAFKQFGRISIPKDTATFTRAIATLAQNGTQIDTAAQNIPKLTDAMLDFIQSINSTDISDKTLRIAEAMAQLSKTSGRSTASVRSFSRSTGALGVVVDSVRSSLKLLAKVLKTVGSALLSMGKNAVSVTSKGLKGLFTFILQTANPIAMGVKGMSSSFKSLLGTMVGFYGIRSAFTWMKEAVSAGADVAETNHIVQETFGDLSETVNQWASQSMDLFGVSENAAKRYAGTLSAMFQASNVDYKKAGTMALDMTRLAGDLSSFYNIDTETAFKKIQSGMAGQSRPLLALGIDMRVAALEAYRMEQGITKSYSAMDTAEKTMLRYQYLMSVTSKQQGDFAATSTSMANGLRTMKALIQSIAATLGDALASALRHVVAAINGFLKVIQTAVKAFAVFMQTIFGRNISGGSASIGLEDVIEDATDSAGTLDDNTGAAADNLGTASDNAKKLKKELAVLPFDELNQLAKPQESTSSSGGSGGAGSGGGIGTTGVDLGEALFNIDDLMASSPLPEALSAWGQRIKDAFLSERWASLGMIIAEGINEGVQKVYDLLNPAEVTAKVFPYIDAFTTTFNSMVSNIDFDMIGRTIGRGIEDVLQIVKRFIERIDWITLGRAWSSTFNGIFKEAKPETVGATIASVFNAIWGYLYGAVTGINWGFLGQWITDGINELVTDADFNTVSATIVAGINGIVDGFNRILDPKDGVNFAALGIKLGSAIVGMITNIKWENIGTLLGNLWNGAWTMLRNFVVTLGNDGEGTGLGAGILTALSKAVETAHANIDDISETITKFVQAVASDIAEAFKDPDVFITMGHDIGKVIGDVLSDQETWKKIAEAINNIADAAVKFFGALIDELWNRRGEIATAIKDFLQKLDWNKIFLLAAPLIGMKLALGVLGFSSNILKKAVEKKLSDLILGQMDTIVSSASMGFGTFMAGAAGATGVAILLWGSVLLAAEGIGNFYDKMRGGNGVMSEFGGAVDSFSRKLEEMGVLTADDETKIFQLKESFENGDIGEDDLFSKVVTILSDAGVTSEQAKAAIDGLGSGIGHLNDDQLKVLNGLLDGLPAKNEAIGDSLEDIGVTSDDVVESLRTGLRGIGDVHSLTLNNMVENWNRDGMSIKEIIDKIVEEMVNWGATPEEVHGQIKAWLGDDVYSTVMASADNATTSIEGMNTAAAKQPNASLWDAWKSKMESISGNAKDAATNQEDYNAAAEATPTANKTAGDTIFSIVKTLLGGIATKVLVANATKDAPDGVVDSFKNKTETMKTGVQGSVTTAVSGAMTNAKASAKKDAQQIPSGIAEGVKANESVALSEITTLGGAMAGNFRKTMEIMSPSKVFTAMAENIPLGIAKGIDNRDADAKTSLSKLSDSLIADAKRQMEKFSSNMSTDGGKIISSLTSGMTAQRNTFNSFDFFSQMFSGATRYLSNLQSDMYRYGHNISQSLANGIRAVHVSLPHIYVSQWTPFYYGNGGYSYLPNFAVSWYAKGGLFTEASLVAGLGEAGNEAVLPLENRRTMSMIAEAITNSGKTVMGISTEELQEAVATGVAMAMAQNPQTVQVNVHSELRTNDETLAEAVSRGRATLDRRYNPTPSYNY